MSDLVEKVARAIAEAFPSAGRGPSALRTQPIDIEAANALARAAIAVYAEEMAQEVLRHGDTWSGTRDVTQACQESAVDDKVIEIAAAMRSMGERG